MRVGVAAASSLGDGPRDEGAKERRARRRARAEELSMTTPWSNGPLRDRSTGSRSSSARCTAELDSRC